MVRPDRGYFIGGSDARIVMGDDEPALLRLWREKRSEVGQEDLSGNLIAALAVATRYIVTVCYATTVISLGWYPWNFLLVGLLFLIRNKRVHERPFVCCSSQGRMLIGLAGRRVAHPALNSMKATFALSESWQ
jgi:hypothetical protein